MTAVLAGRITAWASDEACAFGTLLVYEGSFQRHLAQSLRGFERPARFDRSALISRTDAAEMLDLNYLAMRRLAERSGVTFRKHGFGLATERSAIEELAARVVSTPELNPLGWRTATMRRAMRAREVPEVDGGWCRLAAKAAGFLGTAHDGWIDADEEQSGRSMRGSRTRRASASRGNAPG